MTRLSRLVKALRRERKIPVTQVVSSGELLDGKIALVIGGSGGIGSAIASALLDVGARVVITGTTSESLARAVGMFSKPEHVRTIVLNTFDVASIPSKIEEAFSSFPDRRIDILINAAGVIGHSRFPNVSEEEFDCVFDANLKGTFFVSQVVAKRMIESGVRGHILNVSSSSALRPASTPYNVSKWAIRGLTLGMADELAPYGITVNAIGPGPTATAMLGKDKDDSVEHATNPSGRFVTPEEVASLAVYMVSGAADMVIGDTFYITGGAGTISMHR